LGYALVIATTAVFLAQRASAPESRLKQTARFLAEHAAPGDVVVFTCDTRAAGEYYLRLLAPGASLVRLSFPPELESHWSWMDGKAMLRRPERLEADAEGMVDRIGGLRTGGRTLWVVDSGESRINDILLAKLGRRFAPAPGPRQGQPPEGSLLAFRLPGSGSAHETGQTGRAP